MLIYTLIIFLIGVIAYQVVMPLIDALISLILQSVEVLKSKLMEKMAMSAAKIAEISDKSDEQDTINQIGFRVTDELEEDDEDNDDEDF